RRVVELRRGKYERFNDQHFCEKLRKETLPILLGVRTVRRILREAGIVSVRRRRPRAHRRRRERKAQTGLMLLWDGSPHDWLEALEIEPIYALSPQAKGRVERMWWTFQDRLVSELRLAGATTASQATAVVERYRLEHNERFAVAPRDRAPAWRPVRPGVDLDRICSFRYEATVRRDNAVRLAGVVIDIPPGPRKRTYADKR